MSEQEYLYFARKNLNSKQPKLNHSHDYFELFIVRQGQLEHFINHVSERLPKGRLVFIRPQDCHALQSVSNLSSEIINVSFPADIARHLGQRYAQQVQDKLFRNSCPRPIVFPLSQPQFERVVNLSNELQIFLKSLLFIEPYQLSMITRVVYYNVLLNNKTPEVFTDGADGFVRVACQAHEYVCRLSKKYLGVSPNELMNKNKMQYGSRAQEYRLNHQTNPQQAH